MHLILTGATGLVGSAVLNAMLSNKAITKISILTRRPVPMATTTADPRINVIIHRDFTQIPSNVLSQLQGADGCVWALGASQTQVNAEEYVSITRDYSLAAARTFATLPPEGSKFRFVYVSGEGATQNPGPFSAVFARVKGETESQLALLTEEISSLQADSVRPAFVDSKGHEAILPYIPAVSWVKSVGQVALGVPVRLFYTSMHSPTDMLGRFLTNMAMGRLDTDIEGKGAFRL